MTEQTWPARPHDGLGGPQHNPMIIQALVLRDCIEEGCDHDAFTCPTSEAIVCDRCTDAGNEMGMVALSQEWPCQYAEVGA